MARLLSLWPGDIAAERLKFEEVGAGRVFPRRRAGRGFSPPDRRRASPATPKHAVEGRPAIRASGIRRGAEPVSWCQVRTIGLSAERPDRD